MAILTEPEKNQLDQRGFLLLESLIPPDTTTQLREHALALAVAEQKAGKGHSYLANSSAQRVWNLVDKGEIFEEAIQQPKMIAAMEYLLGADCTLSSFTVNVLYPGAPDAGLHIDYPLSGLPTPRPNFPIVANSVWFLDDWTLENGATSCVPRSHRRLEALPEPNVAYNDELQICGPRGSVLIVNGAIWHGSSRLVLVNVVFIEYRLCEDEVFEFHQGMSETLIQESTEQTGAKLIVHSGLKSPMRSCPNPRDMELFSELTDRRLNAAAQPHLELPKSFGILLLLVASQRRDQYRVCCLQELLLQGL